MFWIIFLLKDKSLSQSQVFCRLQQVYFQNGSVFGSIHLPINFNHQPCPCWRKEGPNHDAATTMFDSGDGVFRVMRCVAFTPNIILHCGHWVGLWFHHSDQSTFFHMFGVSPRWLVANFKQDFLWISLRNGFLLLFHKGQICAVYDWLLSYGQTLPPQL